MTTDNTGAEPIEPGEALEQNQPLAHVDADIFAIEKVANNGCYLAVDVQPGAVQGDKTTPFATENRFIDVVSGQFYADEKAPAWVPP